jgi:hypothetical protein
VALQGRQEPAPVKIGAACTVHKLEPPALGIHDEEIQLDPARQEAARVFPGGLANVLPLLIDHSAEPLASHELMTEEIGGLPQWYTDDFDVFGLWPLPSERTSKTDA